MAKELTLEERSFLPLYLRLRSIKDECEGVWASFGITSWERDFLENIGQRTYLTESQKNILKDIEKKIFGNNEEDA